MSADREENEKLKFDKLDKLSILLICNIVTTYMSYSMKPIEFLLI